MKKFYEEVKFEIKCFEALDVIMASSDIDYSTPGADGSGDYIGIPGDW